MPKRSALKPEARVEVVLALLRKEESAAALARRYQVSEQTLYRWRDAFLEAGKSGLVKGEAKPEESSRKVEQMERELSKRAQVIGELSLANDLLKMLNRCRPIFEDPERRRAVLGTTQSTVAGVGSSVFWRGTRLAPHRPQFVGDSAWRIETRRATVS